jgi:hypothetical protein
VIDERGNVLALKPTDVVPGVAVFGQNELAELARSPDKLTALLQRFTPTDAGQDARLLEVAEALRVTRGEIGECEAQIHKDQETLAALPGIQETLDRYREAGVEDKLKTQTLIMRAESVVQTADETLSPFSTLADDLVATLRRLNSNSRGSSSRGEPRGEREKC